MDHVVKASGGSRIPAHVAASSALRRRPTTHKPTEQPPKRGMWVMYRGRVGILTNLGVGDIATAMLVNEAEGTNVVEISCGAAELRQAWLDEIPEARRPTEDDGARLGYHRKPA